ncbi:restriction endonuclease subunit S [Cryobacterium sp. RTC2.1]|uniref:restriction endonuclease subunit S n=1 Tax=Cryobacterium sp. RTC2.1 TaxID=3048634 RepID=UPI002B239F3D|nr:restriction endonuclease subunit S [Cryobacterium sp. RTC2.1]MEB0004165.1 restriction endonuclease subunit S [Cryobacterium sp. RTC2.1]
MRGNRIDFGEAKRISRSTFEAWSRRLVPERGDLLLAREAPVGPIVQIPNSLNVAPGQRTVLLRPDPQKVDSNYLYYLLASPAQQTRLLQKSDGSTVAHLNVSDVRTFQLPSLPDLNVQHDIAATLTALDDRINSSTLITQGIQEVLQSQFRSWFVEYGPWGGDAPADWHSGVLSEVLALVKKPIKSSNRDGLPYVPIDALPMRALGLEDFRPTAEAQSSLIRFDEDDILMGAMRVYFHRVVIAPFDGITRTTCFVLRPYEREFLEYALLLCNEDTTIDFADTTSRGSTMPYAVWENGLANMSLMIPTRKVANEFSEWARPLVMRIRNGIFERRRLRQLRDALLPELISGRIRAVDTRAVLVVATQ